MTYDVNSPILIFATSSKVKIKVLPAPIGHRASPISVSIALGHASANVLKATAGGWPTILLSHLLKYDWLGKPMFSIANVIVLVFLYHVVTSR